ncbi:hypothetical protein ACIRS1_02245 [Kitasatospora sp. NPDC101176]|uniref:hypothetical protein n=1 Tax=Kitasatospora sp. NPDC101176 TaxID=3364099 RepID=UPI003809B571
MSGSELVEAVRRAADVGVWRGDGGVVEEAIENIEYFCAPRGGSGAVGAGGAAELAAVLTGTMEAWLRDAGSDGTGRPGVVYAWHDDQAGQLRMSFVSGTRADLPFGARLLFVERALDVVADFLADGFRDIRTPLKVFALELDGQA